MKKRNKKAFTIVELVIVVAVIGVLAAVLIPTFVNLTQKANKASDSSLVANLNKALKMTEADADAKDDDGNDISGKNYTMHDAVLDLEYQGYKLENLATRSGEKLLYDLSVNEFLLSADAKEGKNGDYWQIVDAIPNAQTYNYYASKSFSATSVSISTGFDAGDKEGILTITYASEAGRKVVIRTNSASTTLIINASLDTVDHYGPVGKVDAQKVDLDNCYNEFGTSSYAKVTEGKLVAKNGGVIKVAFANNTDSTKVAVAKEGNGIIEKGLTTVEEVDTANYTNYGVHLEYTDGENPYTESDIESIGQSVIADSVTAENIENAEPGESPKALAVFNSGVLEGYLSIEEFRDNVNTANTYSGYTIKLGGDINLGNEIWTPIGDKINNVQYKFSGTFDGQGHTIKGLFINGGKYKSLFGYGENATFKNFTIEGYASGENVSGVCARIIGEGNCRFENIVNKVNLDTNSYTRTEGSASYVTGKSAGFTAYIDAGHSYFINCVNYGNVRINDTQTGTYTAGIVAGTSPNVSLTFKGCKNYGTITNGAYSGGLIARFCNGNGTLTIGGEIESEYCYNYGTVRSTGQRGSACGGLVGIISDGEDGNKPGVTVSIKNSFNKLNNENNNLVSGGVAGGIVGSLETVAADIVNCENEVPIYGYVAGGIFGATAKKIPSKAGDTMANPYILVDSCVNKAPITGDTLYEHPQETGQGSWSNVTSGGVVGVINANGIRITLRNCQGGNATIQNTVTPDSTKGTYFSANGRLVGLVNGNDTHLEITETNNDTSNHLSMIGYVCIATSGGGGPTTIYIDSGTLVGDFNIKAQTLTLNFAAGTAWHKAADVTENYESDTQKQIMGAHTSGW